MRIIKMFLVTWLLSLVSCNAGIPFYSIRIANHTSSMIENASVTFDDFRSVGGYIRPGKGKKYVGVPKPIPNEVFVVWTSEQGDHKVKVEVRSKLPNKEYEGVLVFEIHENEEVQLKFTDHPQKIFNK